MCIYYSCRLNTPKVSLDRNTRIPESNATILHPVIHAYVLLKINGLTHAELIGGSHLKRRKMENKN